MIITKYVHNLVRFAPALSVIACISTPHPILNDEHTSTVADLAIVGADVFTGERWLDAATVIVAEGKIAALGTGIPVPPRTKRIDGAGKTLLPGLIDAHTHVFKESHLTQAVVFGVTTEIDMFTYPQILAQYSKSGGSARADIISAGILATAPGGHGTQFGPPIPTLTDAEQAAGFVDERLAEGSRFIKIVYEDGSSVGRSIPTIDKATLRALVEAAHRREVLAVVHISSQQAALEAIEAGVDGLAHVFRDEPPSPKVVAAAKAAGIFVTDTLPVIMGPCRAIHEKTAEDPRLRPYLPIDAREGLAVTFDPRPSRCENALNALDAVGALHQAGVPILASTDAPNRGTTYGASVHEALELLVQAGLTPSEALAAATTKTASAFGLDDRGKIEPGRRADLVLVAGDPRQSIENTRDIVAVWKGGERVDRESWKSAVSDEVARHEAQKLAPPPENFNDGRVADFENGTPSSAFGAGWMISTDTFAGGKSTAEMEVVTEDGNHALRVWGTVDPNAPFPWAGVMFSPGAQPMAPANLSSKPILVFHAKSEIPINVMIFAQHLGRIPATIRVGSVPTGKEHRVDLRELVTNTRDITGIFFGFTSAQSSFELTLDDIRLES